MTRNLATLRRRRRITQPMAVVAARVPHEAVRDLGFRIFRVIAGTAVEVAASRNAMVAFVRKI